MWKIKFIILIHISILLAYSQTDHTFFQNLKLTVNDSSYYPDSTFIYDILQKVQKNKINYTISGVLFNGNIIETKIKIPQTFMRADVIKQIVLYYYLLDDDDRKKEYIEIYPFFKPLKNRPWIVAKYQASGEINIWINQWNSIALPKKPSSFEAEIYNQVIDLSYKQSGLFDTVDVKILEQVAKKNDLHISIVEEIYQKVLLWQKSQ
ncbi:MAG: hypothetical protein P8Y99_03175 [Calditrichaceae bacterium]|jgi:hypothetical protein